MSNQRGSLRGLLIVGGLCAVAVLSLALHSSSMKLTRLESRLDIENRLLGERVEALNVELVNVTSFWRLDSLWVAQGRPIEGPGESEVAKSETGDGLLARREPDIALVDRKQLR